MKPIYSAEKVSKTTMEFYPLELHPAALRFEMRLDGEITREGVVSRATIERLRKEDLPIVDFYMKHDPELTRTGALAENAIYWPVPRSILERAEYREGADLYDYSDKYDKTLLEDPSYVLIHKSGHDHRVYNIHGKQIVMPVSLSLWGTRFNLKAVKQHLEGHPNVLYFEIKFNTCYQNHEISGRELGELELKLEGLPFPSGVAITRSWVEDHVINGYKEGEYDFLGIRQFAKKDGY